MRVRKKLAALFAAGWFIPFPIEGNWQGICLCVDHNILRFENGKVLIVVEPDPPPEWVATYRKKGWGLYEFNGNENLWIRSTFLRLIPRNDSKDFQLSQLRDPFIFASRKMLNDPKNDWIYDRQRYNRRVMGTADERLFAGHSETNTPLEMEAMLRRSVYPEPMRIYTASNEVPPCVIEALAQNGFGCQIHANQQWVADEWEESPYYAYNWKRRKTGDGETVPDWNPVWTNKGFKLIIRPLAENDPAEDPDIYIRGEHKHTFSAFTNGLAFLQRRCGNIRTNFHFYAEGGVLPEDVRQMLEPLGMDYHVHDERVLYRGKGNEK